MTNGRDSWSLSMFNRRDWDELRSMLADDVRLVQSTYPLRAGAADVGMFFGIYSRSAPVRLAPLGSMAAR